MTDPVYIPLKPDSKVPAAHGWQRPDYKGVKPKGRVGLRCDGLVVVDCDTEQAYIRWTEDFPPTYTVKTPNGWHLYYSCDHANEIGPRVKPLPGTDIRAGSGSFVVAPPTPGYEVVVDGDIEPWDDGWLELKKSSTTLGDDTGDEWDLIPVGQQNSTLAAVAGTLRRQGASGRFIYAILQQLAEEAMEDGDPNDPWTDEDIKLIAKSIARYEPDPTVSYLVDDEDVIEVVEQRLGSADIMGQFLDLRDMVMPPPPQWWWRPYLPKGRLVMLDGSEGIGKGLFCAYIAEMLSRQGETVLWASTEDDPEEDIQRRMKAAGWTPDHGDVKFFTADPRFPRHIDLVEEAIDELGAGLMILDPGRSFIEAPKGAELSHNNEAAIRPGLEALNRMAKRTGCTIIFIHHWNKNTNTSVQYRQGGSQAYAQVVRHRITLVWVGPTEGGRGAFEVSKSNIAPKGHVHSYHVEPNLEYDTAVLNVGTPLNEFADLGAWIKAAEGSDFVIDMSTDVKDHLLALPAGTKVPTSAKLAKELSSSLGEVEEILHEMLTGGELRKVKNTLVRADAG